MRKLIITAINVFSYLFLIFMFCYMVNFTYHLINPERPTGEWTAWGQFYSKKEEKWIQYDVYNGKYWRDLNNTGNPFDRKEFPKYIQLSPELLEELSEDSLMVEQR